MKASRQWLGSARVPIVVITKFWVPNSRLSFLSQGPLSAASQASRELGLSDTASRIMAHRHPTLTGGDATSKQSSTTRSCNTTHSLLSNNRTLLFKRKLKIYQH